MEQILSMTYLIITVFSGLVLMFILFVYAGKMNGTDSTIATIIVATFVVSILWLKNMIAKVIVISICLTVIKYFYNTLSAVIGGIYGVSNEVVRGKTSNIRLTIKMYLSHIQNTAIKDASNIK